MHPLFLFVAASLSLALLIPTSGCGVRSVAEVESLAARAPADARAIDRLVGALGSRHEEIWTASYAELLGLGAIAAPAVARCIRERAPGAERAVLLLGEMGEPRWFTVLDAALETPALRPYGEEAFRLAEASLWERIQRKPQVAACDAYIAWFPGGANLDGVRRARQEAEARDAMAMFGPEPPDEGLAEIIARWPNTLAAKSARGTLAQRRLADASMEIARGRPNRALQLVSEARQFDPRVEADGMEAAARQALGKALAAQERDDDAIAQLEQAWRMGTQSGLTLAELYMSRATKRFKKGDGVGAMVDLDRAQEIMPSLTDRIDRLRIEWASKILEDLRVGAMASAEGIPALVMAGERYHPALETLVLQRLALGDGTPLMQLVLPQRRELLDGSEAWLDSVVMRALSETDSQVQLLLAGGARLAALTDGEAFWRPESVERAAEALASLRGYEVAVRAAGLHLSNGGRVTGPLPEAEPLSDLDLLQALRSGGRPDDAAMPRLHRAQLLRTTLQESSGLVRVAVEDRARFAASLVGSVALPDDIYAWAVHGANLPATERAKSYRVALADGTTAELRSEQRGGRLRLIFELSGPSRPVSDGALAEGVTVLFGGTRPFLLALPRLEGVEVVLGMGRGDNFDQRVRLTLTRPTVERMNWAVVEGEAPYTSEHAGMVLDQEIR